MNTDNLEKTTALIIARRNKARKNGEYEDSYLLSEAIVWLKYAKRLRQIYRNIDKNMNK